MLRLVGRFTDKSLIKEGTSVNGNWRIVRFSIEKSHNHKKIKIVFTAKGKLADFVYSIKPKEKVDVHFFPECKNYQGKWYTELQAISVEKYVPPSRYQVPIVAQQNYTPELELKRELQLFDIVLDENSVKKNKSNV